jgi:hypothetical protein
MALKLLFETKKTNNILLEINDSIEVKPLKLLDLKGQRIFFITLVAMFAIFSNASENIYMQLNTTYYQYIPLKLTFSTAAEIVSAMALSYTIGRGISVLIAFKIKPQYMIAYHFIILVIGLNILYSGQNSVTNIYIASIIIGFGFSAITPSMYALACIYMEVTNEFGSIIVLSGGIFSIFFPYISGLFIEQYPNSFILSIAINLLISFSVFLIIFYYIMKTQSESLIKH